MHRSRNFSSLAAVLAMTCVFTVACDSGTQEPAAPANSVPATSDDATGSQGDAIPPSPTELPEGSAAAIPGEFPDEVPIYPGSLPAQGKGLVSDGVPMAAVQLQTTDSPKEVYDFYLDKLTREGWTIEEREDLAGKNAITATNGKCTATVLAAPSEDGGSSIFLLTEC